MNEQFNVNESIGVEKEDDSINNQKKDNFEGQENNNDSDKSDKYIEKEIFIDAGTTERKRILISKDMNAKDIQEKYNVSKATSYRARKQGWLFLNYQKKVIMIDNDWAEKNVDILKKSAEIGSKFALRKLKNNTLSIKPYEFEDLVSTAYIRLIELSGHPKRDLPLWRSTVARNAVLDFIKTQIISAGKVLTSTKDGDMDIF